MVCDKNPYPACRFYGILNQLGLYNKNAKILFLVRPACLAGGAAPTYAAISRGWHPAGS